MVLPLFVAIPRAKAEHAANFRPGPDTAMTLPRGRTEVDLLGGLRYGLTNSAELRLGSSVLLGVLHAELQPVIWRQGSVWLASRHRVGYPTPFFNLIAREGSLGLLPNTTDVPPIVEFENELLLTGRFKGHYVTTGFGLHLAYVGDSDDFAVLDFPFLYQRFAHVYAPLVGSARMALQGDVTRLGSGVLGYEFSNRAYLFRVEELEGNAFALESALGLDYVKGDYRFRLGFTTALARFPIGLRSHFLPWLGVAYAF